MEVQRNLGYKCSIYKCFQWVVVGTLKVNLRSPDTQEKEEEEEQKKKEKKKNKNKKKKKKRKEEEGCFRTCHVKLLHTNKKHKRIENVCKINISQMSIKDSKHIKTRIIKSNWKYSWINANSTITASALLNCAVYMHIYSTEQFNMFYISLCAIFLINVSPHRTSLTISWVILYTVILKIISKVLSLNGWPRHQ